MAQFLYISVPSLLQKAQGSILGPGRHPGWLCVEQHGWTNKHAYSIAFPVESYSNKSTKNIKKFKPESSISPMRFSLSSSSSSESPDINATMNGEKMREECKCKLFTFLGIFCWQKGIFLDWSFLWKIVKFYQFFRTVLLKIHSGSGAARFRNDFFRIRILPTNPLQAADRTGKYKLLQLMVV
jgi:hypothetical protein